MSNNLEIFVPKVEDLERCIAAWTRRNEIPVQPCWDLSNGFKDKSGSLHIELRNVGGLLAVYRVTPARVSYLEGKTRVIAALEASIQETRSMDLAFGERSR